MASVAKTRAYRVLEGRIVEKRTVIAESISDGACADYPHYRDQCGYLRALADVLAMCDEIEGDNE